MDCESNPNGSEVYASKIDETKGHCAVIQLAGADGKDVVVIHLARFKTQGDDIEQLIPLRLREILESSDILKVGIEALQDGDLCQQWLGIKVNGLREIYELQVAVNEAQGGKTTGRFGGLQGLTNVHLGKFVDYKDIRARTSAWHLDQDFTTIQLEYAANDALLHALLYNILFRKMQELALVTEIEIEDEDGNKKTITTPRTFSSDYSYRPPGPTVVQELPRDERIDAMGNHTRTLLDQLSILRSTLMTQHGVSDQSKAWWVASIRSLIKLAEKKPVTIEALVELSGLSKGTKGEYLYDFLTHIQAYQRVQVDVKPQNWKADILAAKNSKREARDLMAKTEEEARVEAGALEEKTEK
jgi:hypothetical protein